MPLKMIVTDLDRTLLRTDQSLSEYTVEVLKRCQRREIKVLFATARPRRAVMPYTALFSADAVILHNGAVIFADDQLVHHCGIQSEIKNEILMAISRDYPDTNMSVEIDDTLYANFDVSGIWDDPQVKRTDFTDLPDRPADKIIISVSSTDDIERYAAYLPHDLYIEMNDNKLGLIMHKEATKHAAVARMADCYGFGLDQIVAFGDDYNDAGMLQCCGVGVAVANALSEVKAVADQVCDSNDHDGVARWLDKHGRLFPGVYNE